MHKLTKKSQLALVLTCALAAICWQGTAQARNTRLLLPIDTVVPPKTAQAQAQPQPAGQVAAHKGDDDDMVIIFGEAAVPQGLKFVSQDIQARGEVQPSFRHGYEDEAICQQAFRKAMVKLIGQARAQGANAVVGIVSNYNHATVMDSPTQYECHAGTTRAVVDLKAKLAKIDGLSDAPAPKAN
ncbi:hypothetical protein ACIPF8_09265 [Collimonas sp. NPDC087041]|jgi:uncharacterized protein YbjQ (UPF0145 family)|uniref:hypothetical protein n=1 Tax=Collimonas sp. NPDC087041 TaxID=3363960 RepID=UPI0038082D10